jgi:NDP-sugar pyrophosphorylase family protein
MAEVKWGVTEQIPDSFSIRVIRWLFFFLLSVSSASSVGKLPLCLSSIRFIRVIRRPPNLFLKMTVAILAGGLATRLGPLTAQTPKALLPVAGEPFLAHQLRLLRAQGLTRVVLCVGHFGEQVEAVFGDGRALGMELAWSYDGPRLLGTGGAIAQALPLLGDAFFVLYGDSYLPIDFRAVERSFHAQGQPALMTVFENHDAFDRSNVLFENGRLVTYDKKRPTPAMRHIDYGLSLFTAATFAGRESQPFDLSELQQALTARGEMAGYLVEQRFYEIGSHAGLAELEELLRKGPLAQG